MHNRTRENAAYRADDAIRQLNTRGIDLPDTVADAVDTLTRVRADRPAPPAQTALRDLILAGADQADIDAALLADLGHTRLSAEWQQAAINAAMRVLGAIRGAHDELHPALKQRADVQIEHVSAVAALENETLESLVVAGRHADAERLATVDVAGHELHALYELYAGYVAAGGYQAMVADGVDCTRWRDPRPVEHHGTSNAPTITAAFLGGLRVGGELHFPTADEALAAAQPIIRDQQAQARKLAAERAGQGLTGPVMFA